MLYLHHRLEHLVPIARLPPGHQVQPVHALGRGALLDAGVARELHLQNARITRVTCTAPV